MAGQQGESPMKSDGSVAGRDRWSFGQAHESVLMNVGNIDDEITHLQDALGILTNQRGGTAAPQEKFAPEGRHAMELSMSDLEHRVRVAFERLRDLRLSIEV